MPDQPDILVFMTDQHNARIAEHAGDPYVRTPNMARLAEEGTTFDAAYTSCPLSVPARCSMMSGQLPSRTGIVTNNGSLASDHATMAHALAIAGYETVLCGRMHFKGPDQFHGFTRRLVGDFTPCYDGRYGAARADLGPYVGTPAGDFTKHFGGGTSPVLEYDRAVIAAALDYLAQPRDKPVFLVVSTYGPHHTFVAPPELYRKYQQILPPPDSDGHEHVDLHPALHGKTKDLEADVVRDLRAAYYGMVENIDMQFGRVREAWDEFMQRRGRDSICCYLSDHGEAAGEKGLWGKSTFHEESARIPLIFSGTSIEAARRIAAPVSIMDLAPTLCELTGAPEMPRQDGRSLLPAVRGGEPDADRAVVSELLAGNSPARMVRRHQWKYVHYHGRDDADQLFDLNADPNEYHNRRGDHPDIAAKLKAILLEAWDPQAILRDQERRREHLRLISAWGATVDVEEPYRWPIPESAWALPTR